MAMLASMPAPRRDLASELDQRTSAVCAEELMRLMGYKKSAFYAMCKEARIPHYRFGPSIRFDPHVIARWLREHHVGDLKRAA
jgi:hypothetical protein